MFDLYGARSPVVFKVLIALEEMELPHNFLPVDVLKGEQHSATFTALNPNNRVPALVDHAPVDGGAALAVFESGAILMYLAEKTGRFLPTGLSSRRRMC